MDMGTKLLLLVLSLLLTVTAGASYYRFVVLHDYIIEAEVDCDPTTESCFVWECSAETESCTGNPEEDTWYYKYAYRNAKNMLVCTEGDESCTPFACSVSEPDCYQVLCSNESLATYALSGTCTNPAEYVKSQDTDVMEGDLEETVEAQTPDLVQE